MEDSLKKILCGIIVICECLQNKLGHRFSQIPTDIWFFVAFNILVIRVHPCPQNANSYTFKLPIQAPVFKDYADYQNHAPLTGAEIPTEALIVGLADRYDALRSRRPYKEAYSHEKTLAVLEKDDRSGINGFDWYGFEIWGVFERHHSRFQDVFEGMQN